AAEPQPEPPEPLSCSTAALLYSSTAPPRLTYPGSAVVQLTLRSGSMTFSFSYSAIGRTDSLFLILPLASLPPRLLLLTALSAYSGPHAMLLHILLC
ncbi:unnamed protein product, partial [Closterium sp. NIES-53]